MKLGLLTLIAIMIPSTLRSATPLLFAALGGNFSERSGVFNIALEGIMAIGAFFAVYFSWITGSPLVGLMGAIIVGALFGLLLAYLSVNFKANQVVVGTAINILCLSLTTFLMIEIYGRPGQTDRVNRFADIFGLNILTYVALIMVVVVWFIMYKTPFGLRLRAVGEHPKAADTLGVNVYTMRYIAVTISGMFAAAGGAAISIGDLSAFKEGMIGGRGFIALAALIFGKWNPIGALLACLFFGFAEALRMNLGNYINVPGEFLFALPYILTVLAVSGLVGKSVGPAAGGIPYEKGER